MDKANRDGGIGEAATPRAPALLDALGQLADGHLTALTSSNEMHPHRGGRGSFGDDYDAERTLDREAFAFTNDAYRLGLVRGSFDASAWMATPRGRALREDAEAVAGATATELMRLITASVRAARLGEEAIVRDIESGLLPAVVRRAAVLADAN